MNRIAVQKHEEENNQPYNLKNVTFKTKQNIEKERKKKEVKKRMEKEINTK